jgi:hypothetical protein
MTAALKVPVGFLSFGEGEDAVDHRPQLMLGDSPPPASIYPSNSPQRSAGAGTGAAARTDRAKSGPRPVPRPSRLAHQPVPVRRVAPARKESGIVVIACPIDIGGCCDRCQMPGNTLGHDAGTGEAASRSSVTARLGVVPGSIWRRAAPFCTTRIDGAGGLELTARSNPAFATDHTPSALSRLFSAPRRSTGGRLVIFVSQTRAWFRTRATLFVACSFARLAPGWPVWRHSAEIA